MSYPVEAKHQIVVEKERQFLNFWLRLKPPFQRFYLLQVIWLSCTKFKLPMGIFSTNAQTFSPFGSSGFCVETRSILMVSSSK